MYKLYTWMYNNALVAWWRHVDILVVITHLVPGGSIVQVHVHMYMCLNYLMHTHEQRLVACTHKCTFSISLWSLRCDKSRVRLPGGTGKGHVNFVLSIVAAVVWLIHLVVWSAPNLIPLAIFCRFCLVL